MAYASFWRVPARTAKHYLTLLDNLVRTAKTFKSLESESFLSFSDLRKAMNPVVEAAMNANSLDRRVNWGSLQATLRDGCVLENGTGNRVRYDVTLLTWLVEKNPGPYQYVPVPSDQADGWCQQGGVLYLGRASAVLVHPIQLIGGQQASLDHVVEGHLYSKALVEHIGRVLRLKDGFRLLTNLNYVEETFVDDSQQAQELTVARGVIKALQEDARRHTLDMAHITRERDLLQAQADAHRGSHYECSTWLSDNLVEGDPVRPVTRSTGFYLSADAQITFFHRDEDDLRIFTHLTVTTGGSATIEAGEFTLIIADPGEQRGGRRRRIHEYTRVWGDEAEQRLVSQQQHGACHEAIEAITTDPLMRDLPPDVDSDDCVDAIMRTFAARCDHVFGPTTEAIMTSHGDRVIGTIDWQAKADWHAQHSTCHQLSRCPALDLQQKLDAISHDNFDDPSMCPHRIPRMKAEAERWRAGRRLTEYWDQREDDLEVMVQRFGDYVEGQINQPCTARTVIQTRRAQHWCGHVAEGEVKPTVLRHDHGGTPCSSAYRREVMDVHAYSDIGTHIKTMARRDFPFGRDFEAPIRWSIKEEYHPKLLSSKRHCETFQCIMDQVHSDLRVRRGDTVEISTTGAWRHPDAKHLLVLRQGDPLIPGKHVTIVLEGQLDSKIAIAKARLMPWVFGDPAVIYHITNGYHHESMTCYPDVRPTLRRSQVRAISANGYMGPSCESIYGYGRFSKEEKEAFCGILDQGCDVYGLDEVWLRNQGVYFIATCGWADGWGTANSEFTDYEVNWEHVQKDGSTCPIRREHVATHMKLAHLDTGLWDSIPESIQPKSNDARHSIDVRKVANSFRGDKSIDKKRGGDFEFHMMSPALDRVWMTSRVTRRISTNSCTRLA